MKKIRITENELKQIISESVKKILKEARKPSDRTVGKHTLKGLRYDKNGNPLYTSDTMSDDEKRNQGWKFSKKHGMYGQLSDPTKLSESSTNMNEAISTDHRKALKQLLAKSFSNLNDNEKQYLYDLLSNETWETVYVALEMLKPYNPNNEVNEGKTVNHKPIFADEYPEQKAIPGRKTIRYPHIQDDFFKLKGYNSYQDAEKAVIRGELSKEVLRKWLDDINNAEELHNKRTEKYNYDIAGNPIPNYDRDADIRRYEDDFNELAYQVDLKKGRFN